MSEDEDKGAVAPPDPSGQAKSALRRGWTTGACAAAAARAAFEALVTGIFPDPVEIALPKGQRPRFALAHREIGDGHAIAGVIKDAGDDPDVTHGALILSHVAPGDAGSGIQFRAGVGVGTITRAGLSLPPGEPAINPGPRSMIARAIADAADHVGGPADVIVTVSVPNGEALAAKTLNARLGIIGGISILGTTGVVVPFSCAAWIHSIHRGIDVARAAGLTHLAASTGSTSEDAVRAMYDLPEMALIDMGDFAGGTLKYLRQHPVQRLTIAGGFGKLAKLAAGHLDLHSSRSRSRCRCAGGARGGAGRRRGRARANSQCRVRGRGPDDCRFVRVGAARRGGGARAGRGHGGPGRRRRCECRGVRPRRRADRPCRRLTGARES